MPNTKNLAVPPSAPDGFRVIRLRSGTKVVPMVIGKPAAPRQDPNLLYPSQSQRSTLKRKQMDDTDTDNIHRATLGGNAGTSDYMHKARKLNPPDAPAEFKLKDTGTARCHILADSSVRIIVSSLYVKLKSTLGNSEAEKAAFKLPEPVKTFINAMTNGVNETQISNWMIDDIKQKSNDNLKDVLDWLSHGQANLFFGDAERNLKILHGLDVPIEDGRPTRNAAAIIDAVRSLPQEMLPWGTMMSALQTTRQRDGGSALSSSSTATFNPEIRFAMPHHPNRLKRTKSVSR